MSNRIEDLDIYNLSEVFSNKVWIMVLTWYHFSKDTIGKQLVRSAGSIGANIAEGLADIIIKKTKTSVTLAEVQ